MRRTELPVFAPPRREELRFAHPIRLMYLIAFSMHANSHCSNWKVVNKSTYCLLFVCVLCSFNHHGTFIDIGMQLNDFAVLILGWLRKLWEVVSDGGVVVFSSEEWNAERIRPFIEQW